MNFIWNKFAYGAAILALGLFASCQKDNPLGQDKSQTNVELTSAISLSLDVEAEWEQPEFDHFALSGSEEETPRALNVNIGAHSSTDVRRYPKVKLAYAKGSKVPVVAIIKNAKTGTTIIKQLNWNFLNNGTKLAIDYKTGGVFQETQTFDLKTSPNDWKLFVVMGGTYNEQAKTISFRGYPVPDATGRVRSSDIVNDNVIPLDLIYMTKGTWTPLALNVKSNGSYGFKAKEKVSLRNVGTVFALQMSNPGRAGRFINKLQFSVSNYSFFGNFNLSNAVVDKPLSFEPTEGSNAIRLITSKPGSDRSADRALLQGGYKMENRAFITWGIPLDNSVSTLGGNMEGSGTTPQEWGVTLPATANKELSPNKVYAVNIPFKAVTKGRKHPIEQFFADGSGTILVYPRSNTYVNQAVTKGDPNVVVEGITFMRTYEYKVGEESEYKIIAPTTYGPRVAEHKPFVTLNGSSSDFNNVPMSIKAFGYQESFAEDIRNRGTISYSIRFKNGAGNAYYSAYRYERQNGRVKITVRHLGPTNTNIGINQISNEAWWNSKSPVREIVRYVPSGVYMSTTVPPGRPNVRLTLSVLHEAEENKIREVTESIYTTDHATWGRQQGLPQNQKFGSLLVAEQK